MEEWLTDEIMQKIAIENHLSETAFAVKEKDNYRLRWFTPGGEVALCGHATLATAYVLFRLIEPEIEKVCFDTLSGLLTVYQSGEMLTMDFPSFELTPIQITDTMVDAVGVRPVEAYLGENMVCVLANVFKAFSFCGTRFCPMCGNGALVCCAPAVHTLKQNCIRSIQNVQKMKPQKNAPCHLGRGALR